MIRRITFATSLASLLFLNLSGLLAAKPTVESASFGKLPDGREAHLFTLRNSHGLIARVTDYGATLTAIVGRENLAGTQFHPEKSQATGLKLIANFLRWKP